MFPSELKSSFTFLGGGTTLQQPALVVVAVALVAVVVGGEVSCRSTLDFFAVAAIFMKQRNLNNKYEKEDIFLKKI